MSVAGRVVECFARHRCWAWGCLWMRYWRLICGLVEFGDSFFKRQNGRLFDFCHGYGVGGLGGGKGDMLKPYEEEMQHQMTQQCVPVNRIGKSASQG